MSFFWRTVAFLLLVAGVSGAAAADPREDSLRAMRAFDAKVAAIGHRLATTGLDLCTARQPAPGIALHHVSQYGGDHREAAISAFHLGAEPALLAVVPGSPADRAGLRPDDSLLRLDGEAPPEAQGQPGSFAAMERILDFVDRAFADGTAVVELRRGGERLTLDVPAEPACATRFQLIPSRKLDALADGRYVQLTTAIAEYAGDDDELAWILAHEFAHNVLGHRARLDAAGVERGLLGNFGRNARLIRETETEADRLSVYLMERAGFDPSAAVRFWSRFGRRGLNFLGAPTHPDWRRRIAMFEAEIARIAVARAAGEQPVPEFMVSPAP